MSSLFQWFHIGVIVGNATVKDWYEKLSIDVSVNLFQVPIRTINLYSMWTTMSALWIDIIQLVL